ncbi:hypothetical protein Tco_1502548 [Tanacetum coccineum]
MVIIRKRLQKTKASSYKAKLMHLEDDMGCYTNEMREQAETIADDLRDIAYYIVEKCVETASQFLVTASKCPRDDVKIFSDSVRVADTEKHMEDSTS